MKKGSVPFILYQVWQSLIKKVKPVCKREWESAYCFKNDEYPLRAGIDFLKEASLKKT